MDITDMATQLGFTAIWSEFASMHMYNIYISYSVKVVHLWLCVHTLYAQYCHTHRDTLQTVWLMPEC